jgi:DNA-binding MarR family transcriptional regulator
MDPAEFMRLYPAVYFACHRKHSGDAPALTERQWQILSHLDQHCSVRLSDLSRHLGVSAATVSVAVDRLEREGLAQREKSPTDGRANPVHLTEQGREALSKSSALDRDRVATLLASLDRDELASVDRALRTLHAAAERLERGTR